MKKEHFEHQIELLKLELEYSKGTPNEQASRDKLELYKREFKEKYPTTNPNTSVALGKLVDDPVIGNLYHLSWAYSGARFRLVRIEGQEVWLDNPRNKRKKLIRTTKNKLRRISKNLPTHET